MDGLDDAESAPAPVAAPSPPPSLPPAHVDAVEAVSEPLPLDVPAEVVVEADVGTDSDASAHGHAHAADDAPVGDAGKRRKRRKRGEQPHSRGTPYKALGKPVLVPKWAQGAGPTKLVTRDAFTIALRGVLRGGTFDACTGDHAEHALVFRHQPAHDGLEGYRISCLNKCGLTLKAMMNIGDVETSDGIPAQHVQLLAPGSVLPALEPLLAFPRKPIVKADHVADPCDFRTVGPIMKFVRLVPMQNRMDGDTLVAGGFGFFGDAAWPSLQTSAPSDELRELVPTAQRRVKSKKPLRPWMFDGDVVDDATGVEEKKDAAVEVEEPVEDDDDDPDDAACVPEDERIAEEEGFQPFFKMPASSTDAIDLASSLTIELAFVNFLRKHICTDLKQGHRSLHVGATGRKPQMIPSLAVRGVKLWTHDYHCYARGSHGSGAGTTNGSRSSKGLGCAATATLGCWVVLDGAPDAVPVGRHRLYFVGHLPLGVAHNHTVEQRQGTVAEVYLTEETKQHVASKYIHAGITAYVKARSAQLPGKAALRVADQEIAQNPLLHPRFGLQGDGVRQPRTGTIRQVGHLVREKARIKDGNNIEVIHLELQKMAADDATKGRVGGNVYRRVAANQLKEEFPTTDGHGAFSVVITPGAANAVKQFGKHLSIDATFDCVETIEHQPSDQLFTLHVVDTANHAVPVCSFFGDDKKALTIEAALRIFNKYATEVLGRQYRPEVVMMDDAGEELRAALQVWPGCRCALCCWHVFRNMETRYYLLTGRRTDADWVRIRGQLWNAAQAKQSPKGRVALVEAVGNIFVTLRQPKVPGFDPYHVVDQMLSATVPEDKLEAEKRRATATLKRLGIQKGAARGAAAGKRSEGYAKEMWEFLCKRLFAPDRAPRLFACLNFTAEATMLLCNNHAESFHSKLKHSGFYRLCAQLNMAEALRALRDVHLDIQGARARELARFVAGNALRKWKEYPLAGPFVGFLELLRSSSYLTEQLAGMMWQADMSEGEKVFRVVRANRARLPSLSEAAVLALQALLAAHDGGLNLSTVQAAMVDAARAPLRGLDAFNGFVVTCVKGIRTKTQKSYTVVASEVDGVTCDCWYSCGKKMLCSHAFFVIRSMLAKAASALDVKVNHAAFAYLLYAWLSPLTTVWFGNRAPV